MNFIFCVLVLCSCISSINAQQCPDNFAGTKSLYEQQQREYVKPPKGYKPVFINYVGRHGARHLTKDVNTSFAYQLLEKANNTGALTDKGKELRSMVLSLEKIEKTNFKSISYEGQQELAGIAVRMYTNFTPIFLNNKFTAVEITKEKRTGQSATAFVNSLKVSINSKDSVYQYINDTTLRFYDLSPAYLEVEKEGDWHRSIENLRESFGLDNIINKTSDLFFTNSFSITLTKQQRIDFTNDIFGFITILPSIRKEIAKESINEGKLNFQSFYTCDELLKLGMLDNAEDFSLKGPATNNNGIQVRIAAPLLMDFIRCTDQFIHHNGSAIKLRFAHAETVAPFAAILNIKGADNSVSTIDSFNLFWKAEEIVPLSANIQWALYKKKKDFLIKILLNEKEVAIDGMKAKNFPYYSWKQLRKFYLLRLHLGGLDIDDDYNLYLRNLK